MLFSDVWKVSVGSLIVSQITDQESNRLSEDHSAVEDAELSESLHQILSVKKDKVRPSRSLKEDQ